MSSKTSPFPLFTDLETDKKPESLIKHPLSSSITNNKPPVKEDYYNDFKTIGKEIESPILSIAKNKIPDAEFSKPKQWKREPTSKCFTIISEDIKFTNEHITCVVTKSKNDIIMLRTPRTCIVCNSNDENSLQYAVIGYYNDVILEQDSAIRKIIFIHENNQFIITKNIEDITKECVHQLEEKKWELGHSKKEKPEDESNCLIV